MGILKLVWDVVTIRNPDAGLKPMLQVENKTEGVLKLIQNAVASRNSLCLQFAASASALTLVLVGRSFADGQSTSASAYLIRAPISGHTTRGLTGTSLALDQSWPRPVRAWAWIYTDQSGGPEQNTLRRRHAEWLSSLKTDASDGERASLLRHCDRFEPAYFDAVLIEFSQPVHGQRRYGWAVDFDIDGNLSDEAFRFIQQPQTGQDQEKSLLFSSLQKLDNTGDSVFRFSEPPPGKAVGADVTQQKSESTAADPQPPADIAVLQKRLHQLDSFKTRKQHLEKITAAADDVVVAVTRSKLSEQFPEVLADALYRKGRALGYMELPEVLAVKPVNNPVALQQAFEDNFRRLDELVDTTAPDYILLRIRRERRLKRYGKALDLVRKYRSTHPGPVWHYKKRFDLLTEAGAKLHAHQAAAELWLHAAKPDRPVVTIFRIQRTSWADKQPEVTGAWTPKLPFRKKTLPFLLQQNGDREAVVRLDDKQWTVDGADVIENSRKRFDIGTKSSVTIAVVDLVPDE